MICIFAPWLISLSIIFYIISERVFTVPNMLAETRGDFMKEL